MMGVLRKTVQYSNLLLGVLAGFLLIAGLIMVFAPGETYANEQEAGAQAKTKVPTHQVMGWAFLAASISVGLACIGAGIAVSIVGSAAMGAVSERPELMGRSLVYVGLAEGIAIYGLIIGILILGKV